MNKLAPVWATLWLISCFAPSSLLWVRSDGQPCYICSQARNCAHTPLECCDEIEHEVAAAHADHDKANVAACPQCCKATAQGDQATHFISLVAPAIIPRVIVLEIPQGIEEQLPDTRDVQWSVAPSRAPPRGRAPPFDNSLSLT